MLRVKRCRKCLKGLKSLEVSAWFVFLSGRPLPYIGLSISEKDPNSPPLFVMSRDKTRRPLEATMHKEKKEKLWLSSGWCQRWCQQSSWLSNHLWPFVGLSVPHISEVVLCVTSTISVSLSALPCIGWRSLSIHSRDRVGCYTLVCTTSDTHTHTLQRDFRGQLVILWWLKSIVNFWMLYNMNYLYEPIEGAEISGGMAWHPIISHLSARHSQQSKKSY